VAKKTTKTKTDGAAKPKRTRAPSKKAATKRAKAPAVRRAPEGREFYLVDGRVLADLKELGDALDAMADHVYGHHVTAERNDFSSWVHDIFEEVELAKRIRQATGRHHAQIVIYRHILERT
jgi:hypothetical protein